MAETEACLCKFLNAIQGKFNTQPFDRQFGTCR